MAEVFIAWNQNYNKLIDFIDNRIRRTTNAGLIVHAFLERSVAKKDCPRDLQYVVQHECLTNTADSAEAQLIAYLLRNYLSDSPDERTEASQRKLLFLVQTRPGQHEELLMLLSQMPGFSSRNFARIYQLDEELRTRTVDDERRRQDEFLDELRQHSQKHTDRPKIYDYANSVTNCDTEDAGQFRKAEYLDSNWNGEDNRGLDQVHRNRDRKQNGEKAVTQETDKYVAEKSPYVKKGKNREANDGVRYDAREMQMQSMQNAPSKKIADFEVNYEKHRICEECLENIREQMEVSAAPSARRTWPNTRSGRRRQEERRRVCGMCMEKFHCYHQGDEKIKMGLKAQDSFESSLAEIDNHNIKYEVRELKDDDRRYLEDKISSKPSCAPWGSRGTSKCSCSDTHICTACFIKRLEPITINKNEAIYPKRGHTRERPDTSPAALHGDRKDKEKQLEVSREREINIGKDKPRVVISKGENEIAHFVRDVTDIAARDDTPADGVSLQEGSEDNSGGCEEEPKNNEALRADCCKKESVDDSMRPGLIPNSEEDGLMNDKELQSNLDRLLAELELKSANGQTLERGDRVINEANDVDHGRRNGLEFAGNEQSDALHWAEEEEKGFKSVKGLVDNDWRYKNGSSSRISLYDYDYEKKHSRGIIANGVESQGDIGPRTYTKNDNRFEYNIFDELDKEIETGSLARKGRRLEKSPSNQGDRVDKDGKYVCKFCPDKKFRAANVWKIHMKNSHKKCNCPCGEYFETREDYLAHFYKLFPLACFLERKCPERFRSLYFQAVHHRERHFSDRPFYCVQCFDPADDSKGRRRACFKDMKSLRIHAEGMGHDPGEMFLISSQTGTDVDTLPWSMKCSGIDFC